MKIKEIDKYYAAIETAKDFICDNIDLDKTGLIKDAISPLSELQKKLLNQRHKQVILNLKNKQFSLTPNSNNR